MTHMNSHSSRPGAPKKRNAKSPEPVQYPQLYSQELFSEWDLYSTTDSSIDRLLFPDSRAQAREAKKRQEEWIGTLGPIGRLIIEQKMKLGDRVDFEFHRNAKFLTLTPTRSTAGYSFPATKEYEGFVIMSLHDPYPCAGLYKQEPEGVERVSVIYKWDPTVPNHEYRSPTILKGALRFRDFLSQNGAPFVELGREEVMRSLYRKIEPYLEIQGWLETPRKFEARSKPEIPIFRIR